MTEPRTWRDGVLSTLTKVQLLPTPFITTFMLIHLAAPAMASIGGSSLSSEVMLLGREYYQTRVGESLLVWTPLGLHIGASLAKRVMNGRPRHGMSLLTMTAYPLLLAMPLHSFLHRFAPTNPSPPISALGPSQLDYEFVKVGLSKWPWRSWIFYGSLVGLALVHSAQGWAVVWRAWTKRSVKVKWGWKRCTAVLAGLSSVVLGVATLAAEPAIAPRATVARILSVYETTFPYNV